MQESINFATAYRPSTFAEVVGQDVPKSVLRKIALAEGISVRSIFLKGSYGSGKSTLCRIFGRAMSCEKFKELGDVCNECDSCKEASVKNSQHYFEFDSAVAGNIESIRNLQEKLSYIPNGRRVVVFDECQSASKAALNGLLKMVEDGVPNTVFVFASTEDILPTIKSRSLCLEITTIPHDLIKQRLIYVCEHQNIKFSDLALDEIASKSGGHMRDALSILQLYSLAGDEALKSSYSLVVKFFKAACSNRRDVAEQVILDLGHYTMIDVKNSIYRFIKNAYCSVVGDSLYPFVQTGTINKIYSYTFSQVSQMALKDEVGLELFFRAFLEKVSK